MDKHEIKKRLVEYYLDYQKKLAENAMTGMNQA